MGDKKEDTVGVVLEPSEENQLAFNKFISSLGEFINTIKSDSFEIVFKHPVGIVYKISLERLADEPMSDSGDIKNKQTKNYVN